MTYHTIGIVHPGEMGISIAAAALTNGHRVCWASEGRGPKTRERAAQFHLEDMLTLRNLSAACSLIVSVCPPHAAETVAQEMVRHGYSGLYLDANAIAPRRASRMDRALAASGATFVDGGIIGGPAWIPGQTHLYLSGAQAEHVAPCFSAAPLATHVMGTDAGRASALKMCFAAYTKGATALLCAISAAAERLDVSQALAERWSQDDPGSSEKTAQRVRQVTKKAWRYAGEMEEIATTFVDVGLPGEFHSAAATIYERLASFKEADELPLLEEVLEAICPRASGQDS